MSDAFWGGLFTLMLFVAKEVFDQMKANRISVKIDDNTKLTRQGTEATTNAAEVIIETANKVDSATRSQVSTASAAATIAKSAAREAKAEKDDAKDAAKTTVEAVKQVSTDINQLKEIVNGYLTQRLQEASKSGYAMGVSDAIGTKVEDHDRRIGHVETKLGDVDSKVGTILELVRGDGDRATIRGESK